jgi:Flp pilus assembly pilin Flp
MTKLSGEAGASLVEYGLLLMLVAVVGIMAISLIGTSVSTMLSQIANRL